MGDPTATPRSYGQRAIGGLRRLVSRPDAVQRPSAPDATSAELTAEIIRLGPWHHDVEVRPGLTTRVSEGVEYPPDFGRVTFLDWHDQFIAKMLRIYPDGLDGRSVFDCSCNCGECLFWAKEIGAGDCFGSDVREHWIDQARFLLRHREPRTGGIRFEVCDLYDIPKLGLEPFDITFFHGVFYHLPDPITGLNIAADLTNDLLVFNSATRARLPDGMLSVSQESREFVLSGVYGLNWFPTGPEVVERILRWMGFVDTELVWWIRDADDGTGLGRLEMLATKLPGGLDAYRNR